MLEVHQIDDEEVEQPVGVAQLNSMSSLYIDDVLAVVERGAEYAHSAARAAATMR